MALITTAAREELIALFVAMFRAAPGANNLNALVAAYESGATTAQIAASLATRAEFQLVYPSLQTAEEFAAELVETMLDAGTPAAAVTWATNWVVTNLQAGKSRAQVITEAVQAIRATTNPNYATAQAQLENKVEVATYYSVVQLQSSTSLTALQNVVDGVTADDTTVVSAKAEVDGVIAVEIGQTFALTTGVDNITGTAGNDVINAAITGAGTTETYTALDSIKAGDGVDTLNITATSDLTAPAAVTITGVEAVNILAAAKVGAFTANGVGALDLSTALAGVTALTVSGAPTEVDFKAPTTAAVTLTNATAGVEIVGGTSQNVTLATQGGALKLSGATGDITVTSSKQGTNTITLDNGVAVNLTNGMAATAATTQGAVTIGATTRPTGAVSVTNTVSNAGDTAGIASTAAAITVNGGSTVSVTQTATQAAGATAGDANTANSLTQGKVIVNGGTATTSVTTSQSAAVGTAVATATAVTGVTESTTLQFKALAAGETQIINGLTFTAGAAGTTAAQTAAAFASLDNGALQGYSNKGTYTGAFSAEGWTSGAASGDTVVFTASAAGTRTDLADTGTGADPTVLSITQGVAAVTAAGKGLVVQGVVEIDDVAVGTETDTIATVSVTGYATGSFVKSDALTTLTLAKNTASASMAVHNNTATTLALNLDTLATGSTVNLDAAAAKYTALNINATGGNSTANITAAAVTALTVAGDKTVTLTGSTLTALKTVTVSGAAGVTVDASGANVTSVSAAASSGANTITVDAGKATYAGGTGADKVTLATTTALTKAVDLGAGDDTVTFGVAVTGSTASLSGGDGTDTVSMTVANADALDASVQTFYTGFERLTLNNAAGDDDNTADTVTVNVANLGLANYVTTNGTLLDTTTAANSDTLVLDNVASGGTVVIAAAAALGNTKHTINVKDATTGTADSLNLVLSSAAGLTAGVVTAAKVESVSLSTVDTSTTATNTDAVTLTLADATAVTVTGAGALTLTMTGSTKVTSIDASARTGAITVTSVNTTSATTIKGGTAADNLTAATGSTADVLQGGAGADVLTANAGLTTLTGGDGNDTFVISTASTNVNSYSTITDATKGDYIRFVATAGTEAFKAAAVTLGDTAVFQDYANAAINTLAQGEIGWFQFGGNTYVVQDAGAETTSFTNGEDLIVKLTGLVDLSTASFDTAAYEVRIG